MSYSLLHKASAIGEGVNIRQFQIGAFGAQGKPDHDTGTRSGESFVVSGLLIITISITENFLKPYFSGGFVRSGRLYCCTP